MSEEVKDTAAEAAPKKEEPKMPLLRPCNKIPKFYAFTQNNGIFHEFDDEESMRQYFLEVFKEMKDVFDYEANKDKKLDEVIKVYDETFLAFLKEVKEQLSKLKPGEAPKIDDKYALFDTYGRIITNFSVVAVALPDRTDCRIVVSKSLFYHYLQLMAVCSQCDILELSAVFSTASYSDGSLTVSFDEKVPKEQRKVDFVKPFFYMGVDGITKGISFQFVEAKGKTVPESAPEKKEEDKAEVPAPASEKKADNGAKETPTPSAEKAE